MRGVERSEQRDAALSAILPLVAEHGWSVRLPGGADWLFNGSIDRIEAYLDLADRRMAKAASSLPASLSKRVRALIALRLAQAEDERVPARRAVALLALPSNAAAAARTLARTVDAIWHAAGDRSADVSWYTKRANLATIYAATLLYWLHQDKGADPENEQTLAFLDRRLAALGRIGKLRARLTRPPGGPAAAPLADPA